MSEDLLTRAALALHERRYHRVGRDALPFTDASEEAYCKDLAAAVLQVAAGVEAGAILAATPSLQVRYDVLQKENARLQASEAEARKELAALRQAPDTRPKTFGSEHKIESLHDALAEIRDLKASVVAFAAPAAVEYARSAGLLPGHLFAPHYDLLARCGARMTDFTRVVVEAPRDA